jgi:Na+/H+-dicarboxylate symporter
MFRHMPFILIGIVVLIVCFYEYIPYSLQAFLYGISLSIKSLIIFLLPFIIFGLLFKAATNLASHATKIVSLILIMVCCSNFLSTFLSHYVGEWIYHSDITITVPAARSALEPRGVLEFPKLIPNSIAMFLGLGLGILLSCFYPAFAQKMAHRLNYGVGIFLRYFSFLIPFFVGGFIIKLQAEGTLALLIKDYTIIFLTIATAQFSYIILLYFVASKMRLISFVKALKNMFPSAIAGFSTMSSAAAMPLTLLGVQKNVQSPSLARSVIPSTVNVHLIGDCFAIPILAYAILKNFEVPEPSLGVWMIFTFYFVFAKFSVAAIPGGGIIVMLPILENYLGFNAEMMSLITALYIFFDPVITSANVLGNGGFAMILDQLFLKNLKAES